MIQPSFLSPLFSIALHAGIVVAAVAHWRDNGPQPAPVQAVQVVFEDPPVTSVLSLPQPPSGEVSTVKKTKTKPRVALDSPEEPSPHSCAEMSRGPKHQGAGVQNPLPKYPLMARRRDHEGQVYLEVSISPTGKVLRVDVKKGCPWPELNERAVEMVKTWTFLPALTGGLPCSSRTQISFNFQLKGVEVAAYASGAQVG